MRGIRLPEVKRARALRRATHSTKRELAYNEMREDFIRIQGYRIVRFTNAEIYEQSDSVFERYLLRLGKRAGEQLWCSCDRPLTLPLPALAGRGGLSICSRPTRVVHAIAPSREKVSFASANDG